MKLILLLLLFSFNVFGATIISNPPSGQPVNTVVGTTASYTVPAGKWAKVEITLRSSITLGTLTGTAVDFNTPVGVTSDGSTVNTSVYLKSGDILTFSTTNASGSSALTTGGTSNANLIHNSNASSSASINGVVVSSAKSTFGGRISVSGSSNSTMGFIPTTTNSSGYIASEYNNTF